ncbi:MAG: AgmX/PglI C-terminal domain-containing protein [Myxococcota bacterium]
MSLWGMLLTIACSGEVPNEEPTPPVTRANDLPAEEPEPEPVNNPEDIKKVLSEKGAEVRACYDEALAASPNLAGDISLDVIIREGKVVSSTIAENTTNNVAFARCIKIKVDTWAFAPDTKGDISLPFVFRPTDTNNE